MFDEFQGHKSILIRDDLYKRLQKEAKNYKTWDEFFETKIFNTVRTTKVLV